MHAIALAVPLVLFAAPMPDARSTAEPSPPHPARSPSSATSQAAARPVGRIGELDEDGDGKLSRSEYCAVDELFASLDADSDGSVDPDEIAAIASVTHRLRAERWRDRCDRDADGRVSRAEAKAECGRRFDRLDRDHDGFLTVADRDRHRRR